MAEIQGLMRAPPRPTLSLGARPTAWNATIGEIMIFAIVPALFRTKVTHDVLTGPHPHDFAVFFRAGDVDL